MDTKNKYFITTAINYTNGPPHIGHCYEAVLADCLARYHRLFGKDVRFLTGTDEHGLKISQTAQNKGMTPIELCNYYSKIFENLDNLLEISHDFFIRTTMPLHEKFVIEVFQKIKDNNDIYLGQYEGWYNIREETYLTDMEAAKTNFKDPVTDQVLTKFKEPSYFFKLSKYANIIKKHIEDNPNFIFPQSQRNTILSRLNLEVHDLSISRTTFDWGIAIPNDSSHFLYVWFEALINYYSGSSGFWPANVHVIGKDILWFHAVIWPAMLLSANLELPQHIFVHNFICDEHGRKMSKSLGNVVDVEQVLQDFSIPILRTYLIGEFHSEHDLHFSYRKLTLINNEQADKIGNLVNRVISLSTKYCQGFVPSVLGEELFDLQDFDLQIRRLVHEYNFYELVQFLNKKVTNVNEYLVKYEPWNILTHKDPIGKQTENDRQRIIRTSLEALRIIAIYLEPIQPSISKEILHRLGAQDKHDLVWNCLSGPIIKGPILFQKIELNDK